MYHLASIEAVSNAACHARACSFQNQVCRAYNEAVAGVCLQLVIALEYCHAKQVVNRDLKP